MKRKSKLTLQERSVIEISLYQGTTLEEIGLKLDRHPTTIAREIKSNIYSGVRPQCGQLTVNLRKIVRFYPNYILWFTAKMQD